MSDTYNPDVHQASFEKETMSTHIYTVRSFEEACSKLLRITPCAVTVHAV